MRRVASVLLSVLVLATATAHAAPAPAPSLQLSLRLFRNDSFTGTTPVTTWSSVANIDPILDPSVISYTLTRPGGSLASTKDFTGNASYGVGHSSFGAMVAALSAPWTLDITTQLGTSRYSLTPDLSVIPQSAYVYATVLTPQFHQVLSTTPTFNWVTSQPYTYGYAIANNGPTPVSGFLGFGLSLQSWTPATPLTPGNATFLLDLFGVTSKSFPFTATRLSGVDQGPITSFMSYEYGNYIPYTIAVPEPAFACVAAPLALVGLLRRRRRSA